MTSALFVLTLLAATLTGVCVIARVRGRRNWARDDLEAEKFIEALRPIKTDVAWTPPPSRAALLAEIERLAALVEAQS